MDVSLRRYCSVSKKALGEGLDALFGGIADGEQNVDNSNLIKTVALDKIRAKKDQPRKIFDEEALIELADSIKEIGIIQPILVSKNDNFYEIITGERRFRAATLAGLNEVPVIITKYSREEELEIALIENIQREDLKPIEEAEAYKHLIETLDINQDELAKKIGKNRSTIANCIRLLKLEPDMKEAINKGNISSGHARAILSVLNPADQRILFNRIIANGLSVRETEKQAAELNKGIRLKVKDTKPKTGENSNFELLKLEQNFIEAFGTKVKIKGGFDKGKIEISYFSKDDLDRLYEIITGK